MRIRNSILIGFFTMCLSLNFLVADGKAFSRDDERRLLGNPAIGTDCDGRGAQRHQCERDLDCLRRNMSDACFAAAIRDPRVSLDALCENEHVNALRTCLLPAIRPIRSLSPEEMAQMEAEQRAREAEQRAREIVAPWLEKIKEPNVVTRRTLPDGRIVIDHKSGHLDGKGFIVQRDGNGNDGLNRLGHLYSLLHFLRFAEDLKERKLPLGFREQLGKLTHAPGHYRRHWDKDRTPPSAYNPHTTSRDQYTPVIIAADLLGSTETVNEIRDFIVRSDWRFPNQYANYEKNPVPKRPDIVGPTIAADLLRSGAEVSDLPRYLKDPLSDAGGRPPAKSTALARLDCVSYFMSQYRVLRNVGIPGIDIGEFQVPTACPKYLCPKGAPPCREGECPEGTPENPPDCKVDGGSDDLNHTLSLLYGLERLPTKNLKAAAHLYFIAPQSPARRLAYYFRQCNDGPPLDRLYEQAILLVPREEVTLTGPEIDQCRSDATRILKSVLQREWSSQGENELCRDDFYRPHNPIVKRVAFDISPERLLVDLDLSVTCRNSKDAFIKMEVLAELKTAIEINPTTCEVLNAKIESGVFSSGLANAVAQSDESEATFVVHMHPLADAIARIYGTLRRGKGAPDGMPDVPPGTLVIKRDVRAAVKKAMEETCNPSH